MNSPTVLEEKNSKARVRELFDSISARYDCFNQISSLGLDQYWRAFSLRLGEVGRGMTILDIGMGTGEFALKAAQLAGPDGKVYGIDFSEQMLRIASSKFSSRGASIFPLIGRAEAIPTKPDQFDRLMMAFTLRNVTDSETTLRECLKVLKKGGKLIILEITRPFRRSVRALYQFYMSQVIPRIGQWVCGERWPFDYLNQSVMEFQTPEEICSLMRRVGFQHVGAYPLTLGVVHVLVGEK